jgi:hypothetical protein
MYAANGRRVVRCLLDLCGSSFRWAPPTGDCSALDLLDTRCGFGGGREFESTLTARNLVRTAVGSG